MSIATAQLSALETLALEQRLAAIEIRDDIRAATAAMLAEEYAEAVAALYHPAATRELGQLAAIVQTMRDVLGPGVHVDATAGLATSAPGDLDLVIETDAPLERLARVPLPPDRAWSYRAAAWSSDGSSILRTRLVSSTGDPCITVDCPWPDTPEGQAVLAAAQPHEEAA